MLSWKSLVLIAVLAVGLLTGCPRYYTDQALNHISIGQSKEYIITYLRQSTQYGFELVGMKIRAARQTTDGKMLEVGEVPLIVRGHMDAVPHWFLFENGRLVQWGRPEDWRNSSARYEIQFNPSYGVTR